MEGPLRVAVVNDYEVIVAGVAAMLADFGDRVEVVDGGAGGSPGSRLDVALFDTYALPDFGETDVARLAADDAIGAVVVYTNSLPPDEVSRLLAAGAAGCLNKSLGAADLLAELELIVAGETRVSAFEDLPEYALSDASPGAAWGLTYRESEVLALLARGLRNKEIGAALYIGTETVKSHLTSIFQKLEVSSRTQAIALALRSPDFRGSGAIRASDRGPRAVREV